MSNISCVFSVVTSNVHNGINNENSKQRPFNRFLILVSGLEYKCKHKQTIHHSLLCKVKGLLEQGEGEEVGTAALLTSHHHTHLMIDILAATISVISQLTCLSLSYQCKQDFSAVT